MPTAKIWVGMTLLSALVAPPVSAQLAVPPSRDNTLFEEFAQQEGCSASTSNGAGRGVRLKDTAAGSQPKRVPSMLYDQAGEPQAENEAI